MLFDELPSLTTSSIVVFVVAVVVVDMPDCLFGLRQLAKLAANRSPIIMLMIISIFLYIYTYVYMYIQIHVHIMTFRLARP